MENIWHDIPGIPGYQITKDGQVRSNYWGSPKIRKHAKNDAGYHRVNLRVGGTTKVYSVHRLVAMTFLDNPEGKPEVNHKNGRKDDNSVGNLEWVTSSENSRHAAAHGLWKPDSLIASVTKLSPDKVREIRSLRGIEKPIVIAGLYGVSPSLVYGIMMGRRRGDVI